MHAPRNLLFLAAFFIIAGLMHFVVPAQYESIVPSWVPYPATMVVVSGIAEAAGGIGLLMRPVRRLAAGGLILLLIAVFPANIEMLREAVATGKSDEYQALLYLRLPFQSILIVWLWRSAIARRRD